MSSSVPPAPTPARSAGRRSPIRPAPSHPHLVTLPIHNPTLAPPLQNASSSRSPLYGLPGVSTSTHSLGTMSASAGPPGNNHAELASLDSLVPHLTSAEAHLGRMTLTAPDNMMRRRAQERDKERKIMRIAKKQERAREAMSALAATSSSRFPHTPSTLMAQTEDRSSPFCPSTPQDPGSSGSSGGPTGSLHQKPAIAAHPRQRPGSNFRAEGVRQKQAVGLASNETGSQGSMTTNSPRSRPRPRPHPRSRLHPMLRRSTGDRAQSDEAGSASACSASQAAMAASPSPRRPTAGPETSSRRHEVLPEIPLLASAEVRDPSTGDGLPFASDSGASSSAPPPIEADPSPPPFPEGSTRPASPPRRPPTQEGDLWTSEDDRLWTEYRRTVPDSPPPPFFSEESEGEEEGETQEVSETPMETFEVLNVAYSGNSGSHLSSPGTSQVLLEGRRAWDEDIRRGLTFEQRLQRLEMRRSEEDRLVDRLSKPQDALCLDAATSLSCTSEERVVASTMEMEGPHDQSPSRPPSEGLTAVSMAGDASGNTSLPTITPQTHSATLSAPMSSHLPHPTPSTIVLPPHTGLDAEGALSSPSLPRLQSGAMPSSRQKTHSRPPRPHPCSLSTFPTSLPTAHRPPHAQSSSRAKASAAAERRRLAWGIAPGRCLEVAMAPAGQSEADASGPGGSTTIDASESTGDRGAMPGAFDNAIQDGGDESYTSSSSEAEWEAETAAFEALRRATEGLGTKQDSEEESDYDSTTEHFNSSISRSPMGRLQDALVTAPSPLALGRRRGGGLAYEASDSEDSLRRDEQDDHSESEDTHSEGEGFVQVVNPRWTRPNEHPAHEDRRSSDANKGIVGQSGSTRTSEVFPPRTLNQSISSYKDMTISTPSEQADEQRLRRDALMDIGRLEDSVAPGSSLAALEKLLTESLRSSPADNATMPSTATARLSRQGAITRGLRSPRIPPPVPPRSHLPLITAANLSRSGSFINPRSSFAPLPRQTRLPTVTDATRHFPPSKGEESSTVENGEVDPHGAEEGRPPAPPPTRPRHPLVSGSRVSELLERFEATREAHTSRYNSPAVAPTLRSGSQSAVEYVANTSAVPSLLHRRPPPPPPPISSPISHLLPSPITQVATSCGVIATHNDSSSYSHLCRTDSQRNDARRNASDALTRNEGTGEGTEGAEQPTSLSLSTKCLAQRPPLSIPGQDTPESRLRGPSTRRPLPLTPGPPGSAPLQTLEDDRESEAAAPIAAQSSPSTTGAPSSTRPVAGADQGYITDLDLIAARLDTSPSVSHFDDIALLQEFLGPAVPTSLSPEELSSIPLGIVEVEKRRVTKEGKTKTKLACLGLRVDRCGICLGQFREGQGAYVLGRCLHVFHGRNDGEGGPIGLVPTSLDCAREWFRRSRVCPVCRTPAIEEDGSSG